MNDCMTVIILRLHIYPFIYFLPIFACSLAVSTVLGIDRASTNVYRGKKYMDNLN